MENDAGVKLEYWLSVPLVHVEATYTLRKWIHVKVASEKGVIWFRGLDSTEINSDDVLQIPSIKRYFLKGAQLIPFGKSLPDMVEPSLLWSPILRALKVTLPKENFNFFGVKQTFKIKLVSSDMHRATNATQVDLKTLEDYLKDAPRVRLNKLKWTILEEGKALVIGRPILPISGDDMYIHGAFIIPSGYRLEYDSLTEIYNHALVDGSESWYMITQSNMVYRLAKKDFNQLSKGSFCNTFQD